MPALGLPLPQVDARVKGMRWTAAAVGISFFNMLFLLISLGVPWYFSPGADATLLMFTTHNKGFAKKAGDPAAAFMLISLGLHIVSVLALYNRWAGRTAKLPSSPKALAIFFGITSFTLFLSVTIYAGEVNKASAFNEVTNPNGKLPGGKWGPGFGLTIFVLLINIATSVIVWVRRSEVLDAGAMPGAQATQATGDSFAPPIGAPTDAASYTEDTINPARLRAEVSSRWRKAKGYTTVMGLAILDLLFIIFCLSEPWYSVSGPGYDLGYGVVDTVSRLPSGDAFRKAGDAAFPFAFFAFLAQIYVTFAVTLRFLGRNDGCSGRLPHSLKACVISSVLSSFCCFLSFVIYAGVVNTNKVAGTGGSFGGGFGLILWDWLLTVAVAVIIVLKRGEVDAADSAASSAPAEPGFPSANPAYPPTMYTKDGEGGHGSGDAGAAAPAYYGVSAPPQYGVTSGAHSAI